MDMCSMFMALRHIRDTVRDWDMLDLRWVPTEGADLSATSRALRVAGWNPEKSVYQDSYSGSLLTPNYILHKFTGLQ